MVANREGSLSIKIYRRRGGTLVSGFDGGAGQ